MRRSVLILAGLSASPALADGALSLAEAQRLADVASPTAQIARARLDKAEAVRAGAWTALFPSLTAAATYTRRGAPITRLVEGALIEQPVDVLRGDFTLDLTLFDARALAALSASGSNLDATTLEASEARRAVAFSVSATYYSVLSAERLVDAAARRREAAETTVSEARSRFEAGLAPKNDLTRSTLELAVARQEETSARAALSRARNALATWVGTETLGARALEEPPPLTLPALEAAALEATALSGRGDLAAQRRREAQLATLADEPLYRIVPTLGLRGALALSTDTSFGGRAVDGSVAATLTWRIFDGGLRYAERAQREAELRAQSLEIEATRIRIEREVKDALLGLEEARSTLVLADARAKIAEENAEEVRTLFASGLAGALEQVDAAVAEFEAHASVARQRVAVRVAELGLVAALGAWPGGPP